MMLLLQHYEGSGSSEDLALQTELEQCSRRLESFVSPIRMSQVIKTGNGPLDGMRRKITELSKLPQNQSDFALRAKAHAHPEEAYIISPSSSLTIGLGSILTNPLDPETRLPPKEDAYNIPKSVTVRISERAAWKKLLEGKATIWRTYLDAATSHLTSSERSSKDTLLERTNFESIESCHFKPNNAYLSKALSNPSVRAYLQRPGSAPMYMITGVKIVRGAQGIDRRQEASVNLGFDASPVGVPVMVGPDVAGSSKREQTSLYSEPFSDFVYAYQVSEISRRHAIRDKQNSEFKEGALFSAEQDDEEELDIKSWEIRTPGIETLEEYGEDHGTVLISTEDEY